jgi:hypothetical protein
VSDGAEDHARRDGDACVALELLRDSDVLCRCAGWLPAALAPGAPSTVREPLLRLLARACHRGGACAALLLPRATRPQPEATGVHGPAHRLLMTTLAELAASQMVGGAPVGAMRLCAACVPVAAARATDDAPPTLGSASPVENDAPPAEEGGVPPPVALTVRAVRACLDRSLADAPDMPLRAAVRGCERAVLLQAMRAADVWVSTAWAGALLESGWADLMACLLGSLAARAAPPCCTRSGLSVAVPPTHHADDARLLCAAARSLCALLVSASVAAPPTAPPVEPRHSVPPTSTPPSTLAVPVHARVCRAIVRLAWVLTQCVGSADAPLDGVGARRLGSGVPRVMLEALVGLAAVSGAQLLRPPAVVEAAAAQLLRESAVTAAADGVAQQDDGNSMRDSAWYARGNAAVDDAAACVAAAHTAAEIDQVAMACAVTADADAAQNGLARAIRAAAASPEAEVRRAAADGLYTLLATTYAREWVVSLRLASSLASLVDDRDDERTRAAAHRAASRLAACPCGWAALRAHVPDWLGALWRELCIDEPSTELASAALGALHAALLPEVPHLHLGTINACRRVLTRTALLGEAPADGAEGGADDVDEDGVAHGALHALPSFAHAAEPVGLSDGLAALCGDAATDVAVAAVAVLEAALEASGKLERVPHAASPCTQPLAEALGVAACLDAAARHPDARVRARAARVAAYDTQDQPPMMAEAADDDACSEWHEQRFVFFGPHRQRHECE